MEIHGWCKGYRLTPVSADLKQFRHYEETLNPLRHCEEHAFRYKAIQVFLPLLVFLFSFLPTICFGLPPAENSSGNFTGMVVSSHHLATEVGVNVLRRGGNAIDAAVAVGFALAVVEPCCGNLGGGGFMLIRLANGNTTFLDFRETAPLASRPQLFLDKHGQPNSLLLRQGYLSIGIPGTVKGFSAALKKYGTLTWQDVITPAIDLAKHGFILRQGDADSLRTNKEIFQQQPNIRAIFLKNNGPYQAGDRLIQADLANTLELLAKRGPDFFYQGSIADEIVKSSQEKGGIISKQDLLLYKVKERQPITCNYRGYQIITAPPPSSGGITLCEMLAITEGYPLKELGFHTAMGTHFIVEAMRHAYADRNLYLGDPDFVNNPIDFLLSKQHIQQIQKQIPANKAGVSTSLEALSEINEKPQTTHYSIVDRYGNAVAVTYTLNGYYGAKVIAGHTGFLLNNEIDDFTIAPGVENQFKLIQSEKNLIQSGKRPVSSMTPTIVLKDNQLFMVLGAPGGSTIPTQILETLENVIDYQMDLKTAVNAPRFHHQWLPDIVYREPDAFSLLTLLRLYWMGYRFQLGSPYGVLKWGGVAAILRDPASGKLEGVMDYRRPEGLVGGT